MSSFYLKVAAVKAAMAKEKVKPATILPTTMASSISTRPPSVPPKKRKVDNEPGQSSSSILIPNFQVADMKWDVGGDKVPIEDETALLRKQVLLTVNDCLTRQNAPSTIAAYESILNKEVGEAQVKLNTTLLPLDTEEKFLSLFGYLKVSNPELKWSRVRSLKSALVKYHIRNDVDCIFNNWTPLMQALWTGMSRSSVHTAKGKEPIEFAEVMQFFTSTPYEDAPAIIRLRAMVAVGFFGVRRCAEILSFKFSDAVTKENKDYHLLVRCQKNDQEGIGMHCVIPSIESLGQNSPSVILDNWIKCRSEFAKSSSKDEPLFCTIAGTPSKIGNAISADSFRKALGSFFTGNTSTHSLRKGGARFYAAADAPEQATRDQGGWRTSETMKEIYTALTPSEVKLALHTAANAAGNEFALQQLSNEIPNYYKSNEVAQVKIVRHYVQMVNGLIGNTPWKILAQCKTGIHLKALVSHPNGQLRLDATAALVNMRSSWASHKVGERCA